MDTVVEQVYQESSIQDIINQKIANNVNERSFYVADLQDIYRKHMQWLAMMPRVKPHYAVKCNNLHEIVSFLALLGTGFDCASKHEIDQVLALGVSPDNIIYANPCKTKSFIKHAKNVGVDLMTFDNELELHKISQINPEARLVIRIKGDDRTSRCKFNIKFGADVDQCHSLLKLAKDLNLNVVGVSFHNGSDCEDSSAYSKTIASCRRVFDIGQQLGHNMTLLDIGGGFPGHNQAKISFNTMAKIINEAINTYFPKIDSSGNLTNYEIIAEPGRYYVASAMTLVSMVIAKRIEHNEKTGKDCYMYYLNDGVYGAFNNIIYEHAVATPQPLDEASGGRRKLHQTIMWGPTCDSADCIKRDFVYPEINIGEWIMFKNMGAYTCCVATNFNGFERASVIVAI